MFSLCFLLVALPVLFVLFLAYFLLYHNIYVIHYYELLCYIIIG